jgi:hypothetical protein
MRAATGATDSVVLQLANLHGDISLMLPLDASVAGQSACEMSLP